MKYDFIKFIVQTALMCFINTNYKTFHSDGTSVIIFRDIKDIKILPPYANISQLTRWKYDYGMVCQFPVLMNQNFLSVLTRDEIDNNVCIDIVVKFHLWKLYYFLEAKLIW